MHPYIKHCVVVWVSSSEVRKSTKNGSFVVFQRKDQPPCKETLKLVGQFSLESKRQNMTYGCVLQNPEGTYKVNAGLISLSQFTLFISLKKKNTSPIHPPQLPLSKQNELIICQIANTLLNGGRYSFTSKGCLLQSNVQH